MSKNEIYTAPEELFIIPKDFQNPGDIDLLNCLLARANGVTTLLLSHVSKGERLADEHLASCLWAIKGIQEQAIQLINHKGAKK